MLGLNPIRRRESHPADLLQVQNIFMTIQGEGVWAGWPALFIRFSGCVLSCFWCDQAWDDEKDPYNSVDYIVERAVALATPSCKLTVITGGEPLRQDMHHLVPALAERFEIIQFETAGTHWQDCLLHPQVRIIVSPKTPKIHPKIYEYAHAFKYIVEANSLGEDGLPVESTQRAGHRAVLARPRPGAPIYVSPMDVQDTVKNAANLRAVVQSAQAHGHIAGIQLHKLFGIE